MKKMTATTIAATMMSRMITTGNPGSSSGSTGAVVAVGAAVGAVVAVGAAVGASVGSGVAVGSGMAVGAVVAVGSGIAVGGASVGSGVAVGLVVAVGAGVAVGSGMAVGGTSVGSGVAVGTAVGRRRGRGRCSRFRCRLGRRRDLFHVRHGDRHRGYVGCSEVVLCPDHDAVAVLGLVVQDRTFRPPRSARCCCLCQTGLRHRPSAGT